MNIVARTTLILSSLLFATALHAQDAKLLTREAKTPEAEVTNQLAAQLIEENSASVALKSALSTAQTLRDDGYAVLSSNLYLTNPNFDPRQFEPEDLEMAEDRLVMTLKPFWSISDFFGYRLDGPKKPDSFYLLWRKGEVTFVSRLEKHVADSDARGAFTRIKSVTIRIKADFEAPVVRNVPFDSLRFKVKSVTIEEREGRAYPQGSASTGGG